VKYEVGEIEPAVCRLVPPTGKGTRDGLHFGSISGLYYLRSEGQLNVVVGICVFLDSYNEAYRVPRHDIIGVTAHVEPKSPPDLVHYALNNVLHVKESRKDTV